MKTKGNPPLSTAERERIRAAREAKGLSMQALSKQLYYWHGAVEAVERGRRAPSPTFKKELYKALELDDTGIYNE